MPPKKSVVEEAPTIEPETAPEPEAEANGKWIKIKEDMYAELCDADSETSTRIFGDMFQIDAGPENMRANILSEFLVHTFM